MRLICLLAVLAAGAGCNKAASCPSTAGPGRIKIVSSLPRTGSASAQTTTLVDGIRMALDEAGWKAGEFTLAYEDWDDASPQRGTWDPAVEAANADRAIRDSDVMVYIGTYNSGAAKISMPKLNEAGLVMISPSNTYPGLTKSGAGEPSEPEVYRPSGKINYCRVCPADDIQGAMGAEWARRMGAASVFVLHDRELYGKGIADVFKARAESIGLAVKGYEGIDTRAANYKSLAARIKGENPDLIYFGGATQSNGGQLAKDVRGSGYDGKLMVPDGCFERAFIGSAGAENLNGRCFITYGGMPPERLTGRGKEFVERFRAKFGQSPEAFTVYGYEAARVAIEAIRRAGRKDRDAIRAACLTTREFDGAIGRWSFDANGDTTLRAMSGHTVRNGQFEFVEILGESP